MLGFIFLRVGGITASCCVVPAALRCMCQAAQVAANHTFDCYGVAIVLAQPACLFGQASCLPPAGQAAPWPVACHILGLLLQQAPALHIYSSSTGVGELWLSYISLLVNQSMVC